MCSNRIKRISTAVVSTLFLLFLCSCQQLGKVDWSRPGSKEYAEKLSTTIEMDSKRSLEVSRQQLKTMDSGLKSKLEAAESDNVLILELSADRKYLRGY